MKTVPRILLSVFAVLGVVFGSIASFSGTSHAASHKTMVILEENHNRSQAMSGMPYLSSLASQYGQATGYNAITHPSLPNYLAIFGGSTFGVTSDCSVGSSGCVPAAPSVWGQTLAAGGTAKAYQESMTSNCQTGGSGNYAPRHGPWPYWTDAPERGYCSANDVSMGTTTSGNLLNDINAGNLPVTGEMTPNLCNDAHDCSLGTADNWLKSWVPKLMAGPDYTSGNLTIAVTFDEGDSASNNVAFVVIDPRLSGKTVTGSYNHYALTRWLDDNAGVSYLRNASTAGDLRAAFGLGGTVPTPTPTPTATSPSPSPSPTTSTPPPGACPVTGSTAQEQDLIASVCNVPANAQYGLRDSAGNSMDTVKVISTNGSPAYLAVYHSCTTNPCHVLAATSGDLRTWTYKATLQTDGSQPTIKRLTDGSYLLAYEAHPSHLAMVHYTTLANLLAGAVDSRFDAPDNLGTCEGTPNFYSPVSYTGMVSSKFHLGFHYSNCGMDRQATGTLTNGATWCDSSSAWLNNALISAGAAGKIGDRDAVWHGGQLYDVVEGNVNTTYSPANWRLYAYGFTENSAVQIPVKTSGGSTAFANPSITSLTGPDGTAKLVVSIFIPSEGAAPGEGGELLYTVPDTLGTSQGALPSVIQNAC